jgi:predicted ATPase with chaperone activity
MASVNGRTPEAVKREIATEREQLADSVEQLRAGLHDVTDVAGKLRAKLPLVAAGAAGAGFFLAGGIGATMRLVFRRGRER